MVCFCGDTLTLTLEIPTPVSGSAWVRTNLGNARTSGNEIVESVVENKTILGRAWYDIPMAKTGHGLFTLSLGMGEVGHFEAKCFFLKSDTASSIWPEGENLIVNVEPADTCCANIIYNAFVRQFGPNKSGGLSGHRDMKTSIKNLDADGYTVIPPSGTFRDLIQELDFIIGVLGCTIIHLLPINPTPTTYGRMGRFGSPYAALDFTGIDPALAVFDPGATPLEQFIELVDAVHAGNAKLIIDIAPNHTGWAAGLHETHPEWLVRDQKGKIQAPGAWGVIWEDLTLLDYKSRDLWKYMADVFLTWCARGVDGFRCDAGYMIPVPAWTFIVARVRLQFPDTIFFLEGLGGKISVTREILNTSNFNWAYSELFQNYTRQEIESQIGQSGDISNKDGIMIHFAETHDNNRLASVSKAYAIMRTTLCALCSHNGGFGFANGVEWFATEKIDVHDACSLNWGAEVNQVENIRRLSHILKNHPAFFDKTEIRMIREGSDNCVVLLRFHKPTGKKLVILINPDMDHPAEAVWNSGETGIFKRVYLDLLTGRNVNVSEDNGRHICSLSPGRALCLTPDHEDLDLIFAPGDPGARDDEIPGRIRHQRLCETAFHVYRFYNNTIALKGFDIDRAALELAKTPVDFCRSMNRATDESRVITWQWPVDARRHVMVPPGHFLMVRAGLPFRAEILVKKYGDDKNIAVKSGIKGDDGFYFAIFSPPVLTSRHGVFTLKITVFNGNSGSHAESRLIYLAGVKDVLLKKRYGRTELLNKPVRFLGTNGRGAMMRVNARWAEIESRYDALLSANLNPEAPDNRQMMLIRCRAWLVYQGYAQYISPDCLEYFKVSHNSRCFWGFTIPCGQGHHIDLLIMAYMPEGMNQVCLSFKRLDSSEVDDPEQENLLGNDKPVRLIVRPDVDDRSFHDTTKAYRGPENAWPSAVAPLSRGFNFTPDPGRRLTMKISRGDFTPEPEWQYMVYLSSDAGRGADPHTDLFSPGYFSCLLKGKQELFLSATVLSGDVSIPRVHDRRKNGCGPYGPEKSAPTKGEELYDSLCLAMKHYIVKRNSHKTIIAGYPWFLDWGRDTLIVSRGLIAAGFMEEAKDILLQFATFEQNGTLPNVIFGLDTKNRDTSDAPLWLVAACGDMIRATGDTAFLSEKCGGRMITDILISIVSSYLNGTPNGICSDPETGLIFSPSHFTWMDTNFPAGTPREGYPIEIQALWYNALILAAQIDKKGKNRWEEKAGQVKASIKALYYIDEYGYLSDCLIACPRMSARDAVRDDMRDDALRPNQLFAVTLGAVSDGDLMKRIVSSCEALIVPGAIRSLADRPVSRPLAIMYNGRLLNDPHLPYQGVYTGDEDTSRKPAYHNGTAWTWMFPSFCEAWAMAFGPGSEKTALSFLGSSAGLSNTGSAGQLPEILDGNAPHHQRGCDAQAWGVSEWLRVRNFLKKG